MRTDTERLNFLLQVMESEDEDAAERIQGAFMLGLSGRTALDAAMGAKLVEPGKSMPELTALDLAVAELGRIRNVKGFSEERDDDYRYEELALASALYTLPDGVREEVGRELKLTNFAFAGYVESHLSPDDRKRELTKGIALALCELDRLIRAERRATIERTDAAYVHPSEQEPAREFKAGDRVKCNDPEVPELPKDAVGTLVRRTARGWTVNLDCNPNGFAYFRENEMEHVDG